MARTRRPQGSLLLDASFGYSESGKYQQTTSEQCLRFFDSELYYRPHEVDRC
jgi:hypothetical protein